MSCRTGLFDAGLGALVLTLGLSAAGVAAAQEGQEPVDDGSQPEAAGDSKVATPAKKQGEATDPKTPARAKAKSAQAQDGAPGGAGAPAATTAPTATGATASTTAPAPDKPTESQGLPPRVPWRGTSLAWINSFTTTMMDVGQDTIGDDHESYSMYWRLTLQYYLVDQEAWSFRLRSRPSLWVELTNSGDTTTEREPQFLDLDLLGIFNHTMFSKDLWLTSATYTSGFIFPTWTFTNSNGTVLTTSNRVALSQDIQVLGADSPALKSFNVTGLVRWDHRFSRATTAVNDNVEVARMIGAAQSSQIDNTLGNSRLARETLQEIVSVGFPEAIAGMPLEFGLDFIFSQQFKPELPGQACIGNVLTAPAGGECISPDPNAPNTVYYYGFGASIDFTPVPELGIGIAYSSSSSPLGQNQLREDGQYRNFFYAPDAEFSATLTFNPDALYERLTGPPRKLAEGDKRKKRTAF